MVLGGSVSTDSSHRFVVLVPDESEGRGVRCAAEAAPAQSSESLTVTSFTEQVYVVYATTCVYRNGAIF